MTRLLIILSLLLAVLLSTMVEPEREIKICSLPDWNIESQWNKYLSDEAMEALRLAMDRERE